MKKMVMVCILLMGCAHHAARACACIGMKREHVLEVMHDLKVYAGNSRTGLWATHPPWNERIEHIETLPGIPELEQPPEQIPDP